ncbi:MAG: hypothetical protein E7643_04950 [Ruminococcaceae bacterium]|nr:hypothetical protein [Oscillospiraceae bacterium]
MSKNTKKGVLGRRILICLSLFLLSLCIFSFIGALYIDLNFEKNVDVTLFSDANVVRSPHFFIYTFDDRAGRIGEKKDVTDTFYAQRQNAYVPLSEIPDALVNAFVAIEDKHFREHSGVDWKRTLAASANYVLGFSDTFGASTITQQLVKNMTGNNDITWKRKLQEIVYASDLEKHLSKDEIMELYLNVIHFSDNCNGINAAAEHYFSKSPSELSIAECASIAAITNSPTYYNPIHHPENNLERRNLILLEMKKQGFLSEAEYADALGTPLGLEVDTLSNTEGVNSWYVDMVIEDVICDLMEEYDMSRAAATHFFYTKGLQIDMAMDEEIQRMAEDYYRTAILLPEKENGERAQSAMIVIDSRTGDVLGVVGAVGEKKGNRLQNLATKALRPPGSTIKPLSVYAPALENGVITWGSVYDDVPTDFNFGGRLAWPKNANGVYRGLTDVSYAVAHSTNTVAIRILRELGSETALRYLKDAFALGSLSGENVETTGEAALGLGQLSRGVTLREITSAYTAFADKGVYHPWRSYYRVLDADGYVVLSHADTGKRVLSEGNAAVMTKLLQGVTQNGTSGVISLRESCECAGKTGTTSNDYDRWFIGYTPDFVCGVWCGYEYPATLEGRNLCTNIWNNVMRGIVERKEERRTFEIPDDVIVAEYCKDSGMLPCERCEMDPRGNRIAKGWFVKGTEPQRICDCHVLCEYDCENGGVLHTPFADCEKKEVALIRVERHFPMELYVTDAQYVYRDPPILCPINPNADQAYFASVLSDHCGISNAEKQYNRSSQTTVEDDWKRYKHFFEYYENGTDLIPVPWKDANETEEFFE